MTELSLLRILLLSSLAIAPLGVHRHFLPVAPRARAAAHGIALACAAVGLFTAAPIATIGWLLFTAGSFGLFLWTTPLSLRTPAGMAACVPFLFSNVAAVWLVAGTNDLHLLGYGPAFSAYAALHGNVLGWILVGALAILVERGGPARNVYFAAVLVCFASFLLVALGIDQLHALEPIGVVGLSIAIPLAQLTFLRSVSSRDRGAFALGAISVAGLALTMTLAWCNELGVPALPEIGGVRAMVVVHGALNALVVGPAFLAAVARDAPRAADGQRSATSQPL